MCDWLCSTLPGPIISCSCWCCRFALWLASILASSRRNRSRSPMRRIIWSADEIWKYFPSPCRWLRGERGEKLSIFTRHFYDLKIVELTSCYGYIEYFSSLLTVSFLASPYSAFQLRCVHDDVWLSIISFRLRVDFFTNFNISLIGLNHRIGLHVWNWIFLHHGWNYHDGLRYDVGVSACFSWSKTDVDLPGEVKCHKSLWRGGESMRGMED